MGLAALELVTWTRNTIGLYMLGSTILILRIKVGYGRKTLSNRLLMLICRLEA